MNLFDFLFKPRSVALIGAAHTDDKLGGIILKNLLRYRGRIYPVNPKYTQIMGLKAYPSLQEVPEPVDLSLIVRPASEVPDILKGHKDRAGCTVIVSSGFAEIGQEGLQDEIRDIARASGLRILGPNCMGVFNPYNRLDTFFLPSERVRRPKRGNVAIVSQSGAFLHCIFGIMRASNMGISRAVTYGNALDIDETDLYGYLAENRETDVVVSYIESVRDGRRFIEGAAHLNEEKPLIILKSGKGSSGRSAAYSHTGRLAGRYEVFSSILKQFGIREAGDFDEMTDGMKALSYSYRRPSKSHPSRIRIRGRQEKGGNRVLIITNGGGSGVLAADECTRQGLEVTRLSEAKTRKISQAFPHFYVVNNPLDLTAQVRDADYIVALNELKEDYDGFIIIALTGVHGITNSLAGMLKEFKAGADKPIVLHASCGCGSGKFIGLIEKAGIPVYPSPERAVKGLRALLD